MIYSRGNSGESDDGRQCVAQPTPSEFDHFIGTIVALVAWVVLSALYAPLPPHWTQTEPGGDFVHSLSGERRAAHPFLAPFRALVAELSNRAPPRVLAVRLAPPSHTAATCTGKLRR